MAIQELPNIWNELPDERNGRKAKVLDKIYKELQIWDGNEIKIHKYEMYDILNLIRQINQRSIEEE